MGLLLEWRCGTSFLYERYAGPWQLTFRAAAGLAAFAAALLLLSEAAAVALLLRGAGRDRQLTALTLARFLVYLGTNLVSGFGVCSYLYVGSKSPRPHILHVYGLMLLLHLVHSSARPMLQVDSDLAFALVIAALHALWATNRAIFCKAVTEKLMVLGAPARQCQDVHLWGKALMMAIIISALSGAAGWVLVAINVLRGVPLEEVLAAASPRSTDAEGCEVSIGDRMAIRAAVMLGGMASGAVIISAVVYTLIAWRLMAGVIAALAVRGTPPEFLSKVRGTLRQHMLGILLSLSTTTLVILSAIVNGLDLLGGRDGEVVLSLAVNAADAVADVAGILFLSGIGTLLVREDPKAGDINRSIRSLLHAAVLRGRAPFAFEGQVMPTASRRCIVSFPGRFFEEWKDMTWQSERRELSVACVFLPESDPHQRFGQHSPCPETPGSCWCASLYGAPKPWGCSWFPVWEANVQKAVNLGLELVVVFYPGQVGQGLVDWDSLAHVDLWDGCGLGGSQKGEAAYLQKRGIHYTQADLEDVRSWLARNL